MLNPYSPGSHKVELNDWPKIKREYPDAIVRSKTTKDGVVRLAIYGSGKNKNIIPISFLRKNPSNNFSDLIKMSLSDYNRRTVENAAGEALIDREITQHQYNYIMNILDERESIRAYSKNPTPKSYLNRINRLKATFRVAYATNDFNTIDKLRDEAIDIMDDAVADNDLNDHEMRMVLNVAGPLSQSDNFESFQINPSYNTKVIFISVLSLIILRLFTNAK